LTDAPLAPPDYDGRHRHRRPCHRHLHHRAWRCFGLGNGAYRVVSAPLCHLCACWSRWWWGGADRGS